MAPAGGPGGDLQGMAGTSALKVHCMVDERRPAGSRSRGNCSRPQ